ncbi:hypothetical protein [Azospirillum largimobile]
MEQIDAWRHRIRTHTLASYQYEMGVAIERTGDAAVAEGFYRRAIEIRPDYLEAHFCLWSMLDRLGHPQAGAVRQQACAADPDFAVKGCCLSAAALIASGQPGEAAGLVGQALRMAPENGAVRALAGILAVLDPEGAGSAAAADTGWRVADIGGWALEAVRDACTGAIIAMEATAPPARILELSGQAEALCPEDGRILRILGDARYAAGDPGDAVRLMARAVASMPGQAAPLVRYGFLLQVQGDLTASLDVLENAMALPGASQVDGIYTHYTNALCAALRLEDAEAVLKSAPEDKRKSVELSSQLGIVLAAQDRLDEAASSLRIAMADRSSAAWGAANLSLVLLKAGDGEAALGTAREAVHLSGSADSWMVTYEGLALQQVGRFDEALEAQRKAVASLPENGWVLTNLALALQGAGKSEDALAAHRQAIAQHGVWLPFQARQRPAWAQSMLRDAYRSLGGAITF